MSRLGPLGWQWPRNEGNTLLGWSPSGRELRNYPIDDLAESWPFLQSGTGAVSRSVSSKLRESVSVRDFGAVGDGSTNDSPAIQAAINYLMSRQGGVVLVPESSSAYKIGTQISLTKVSGKQIWLVGEGTGSRLDVSAFTVSDYAFYSGSPSVEGGAGSLHFHNLMFIGGGASVGQAIHLEWANKTYITQCTFVLLKVGVFAPNSFALRIEDNTFDTIGAYAFYAPNKTHNTIITENGFFSCGVALAGTAVRIDDHSDNVVIRHNTFEQSRQAMFFVAGASSCLIDGNYIEYCTVDALGFGASSKGMSVCNNWIALGAGFTLTNLEDSEFKRNRLFDQAILFGASCVNLQVGHNQTGGTASLGPAPWTTPSLINSWVQQSGFAPVAYRKDENGIVHLTGHLTSGTAGTNAFVLPAKFRPSVTFQFATSGTTGISRVQVDSSGNVQIVTLTGTNAALNGVSFPASVGD